MSDSQRALEAFRARQYAGPHPAHAAAAALASAGPGAGEAAAAAAAAAASAASAAPSAEAIAPDTGRVIIHVDADQFYAQVEEVRDPTLRGRPVGVTQKHLVVTCNQAARAQGVTKLMGTAEARRRCPTIALVSGEDLTPYRAASKQIMAVLQRYGPGEKLGLDEVFVDATAEARRHAGSTSQPARRRLAALGPSAQLQPWHGHVHSSATQLLQDSRHRPMDLRAVAGSGPAAVQAVVGVNTPAAAAAADGSSSSSSSSSWEALLRIGSAIAAEARAAVHREAGYRTSAGVACNKMLAKLSSGLHKPDDQTVLPPFEAAAFVAPLPVRALPGVGYKMEQELEAIGVATAADLRALPRSQLLQRFGERVGAFLHAACRGQDPSPVQERGPPRAVTVEDSFKSCPSFAAAEQVLGVLAPDLLARLQEENQVAALAAAAMSLLRRHLQEPFDLTLLNLGAAGFSEGHAAAAGTRSIADMLAPAGSGSKSAAAASEGSQRGSKGQASSEQQQQGHAAGGRAAAAASSQQRRSYSAGEPRAPLLSKRHERQLRERGAQHPAKAEQAQHGGRISAEEGAQEGEGGEVWADLRGLATWRSIGTKRSPGAAGLCQDPAGSRAPAAPQQGRQAAAAKQPSLGSLPAQPTQPLLPPPPPPQQQQQAAEVPVKPPPRPATYRNAEAVAIQQMFCGAIGGSPSSGLPLAGLPPEEKASLELALKLQQEEAAAAAAEAAARKRGAAKQASAAPGGGRRQKQQQGGGPLDAFFTKARGI